MTIYSLAELLHKTVGELMEMPVSEYYGWIEYLNRKHADSENKPGGTNLMNLDVDSMVAALT